jgi:4-diphosphocytidyl-2-C-methyl-D-erythritol kinase
VERGCSLRLLKRIPVAAGLGGGSSDGAAAIKILSRLWGLELSVSEMEALGAELGSDVPFCMRGGTALVEGRGERVRSLPDPPTSWYVLLNPGIPISTASIFSALRPDDWTDGARTRDVASHVVAGRRPETGVNALERPVFDLYPAVRALYEHLEGLAPGRTRLSGSGATLFSWHEDRALADAIARELRPFGFWCVVARGVSGEALA